MKYRILIPNTDTGDFRFTLKELENLLTDVYNEGYEDGIKAANSTIYLNNPSISNPPTPYNPYVTWTGPNDIPCTPFMKDNTYYTTDTSNRKNNSEHETNK